MTVAAPQRGAGWPDADAVRAGWRGRRAALGPTACQAGPTRRAGDWLVTSVHWEQRPARCGGWLVVPAASALRAALVIGHGYGGREGPQPERIPDGMAAFFPCMPGFGLSRAPGIPDQGSAHVVHGIASVETAILTACIEATWRSFAVLEQVLPGMPLGYEGESFGGGLGALAVPCEPRCRAAVLVVPTFGNQPERLRTPCTGSGEAVRRHVEQHPQAVAVLGHFDAAVTAADLRCPALVLPADRDPAVPPVGQWSVAHAIPGAAIRRLTAGHPTPASEYLGAMSDWKRWLVEQLAAPITEGSG